MEKKKNAFYSLLLSQNAGRYSVGRRDKSYAAAARPQTKTPIMSADRGKAKGNNSVDNGNFLNVYSQRQRLKL